MGEPITFLDDEIASGNLLAAPQSASIPLHPPHTVCGAIPSVCELCRLLSVCMSPALLQHAGLPHLPLCLRDCSSLRSISTRLCWVLWEPLLTALAGCFSKPTDIGL